MRVEVCAHYIVQIEPFLCIVYTLNCTAKTNKLVLYNAQGPTNPSGLIGSQTHNLNAMNKHTQSTHTHAHARTFLNLDAFGFQEFAQLLDFLLQLADQLGVGVLVDHCLAYDCLGTIRITGHGNDNIGTDRTISTNYHHVV